MPLLTASEAAERLRVPRSTVASWADPSPKRGWIDQDGTRKRLIPVDHKGPRRAARYEWQDLIEAERATRNSPYSKRNRMAYALTPA